MTSTTSPLITIRVVSNVVPQWFVDLPEGQWRRVRADGVTPIVGNTLADVNPYPSVFTNRTGSGQDAGIRDWTGGAVNQSRRTMYLPCGGGHNGWWGNEVYACNWGAENPLWKRLSDPTPSELFGSILNVDATLYGNAERYPGRNGEGYGCRGAMGPYYSSYLDGRPMASHNVGHPTSFGDSVYLWGGIESSPSGGAWGTTLFEYDLRYIAPGTSDALEDRAESLPHPGQGIDTIGELAAGPWINRGQLLENDATLLSYSDAAVAKAFYFCSSLIDPINGWHWTFGKAAFATDPRPSTIIFDTASKAVICAQSMASIGGSADHSNAQVAIVPDTQGDWTSRTVMVFLAGADTLGATSRKLQMYDGTRIPTSRTDCVVRTPSGVPIGVWDAPGTKGGWLVYHDATRSLYLYQYHGTGASDNSGSGLWRMIVPDNPRAQADAAFVWTKMSATAGGESPKPPSVRNEDTGAVGPYSKFNIIDDMGDGQSALVLVMSNQGPTWIWKLPRS